MIEQTHDDAGLDVEISGYAGKLAHVLVALLASMRLDAIGGPMAREANRVAAMLARDKAYQQAEDDRKAAILEIHDGTYINVGDAVVPPTPEWLSKHESKTVTVSADGEGHHARSVKTVRRVATGHHIRAFIAGKITEDQMKACAWYREQFEASGLEGLIKSASFEPRIHGGPSSGVLFNERQQQAQGHIRNARLLIPRGVRKFFDLVILEDVPIAQAAKRSKSGRDPYQTIRKCADIVSDYSEAMKDAD